MPVFLPPSQPPGVAPDQPAPPAVDVAVLDVLIDEIGDGTPELLAELLADYLEDAPGRVATLSAEAALGDRAGVAASAHQLRSGSAVLGATKLAGLLTDAELRSRRRVSISAH